jgi:hypothetical protein
MKTFQYLLAALFAWVDVTVDAQTVNWSRYTPENKHFIDLHGGTEFGMAFGIAAGTHFRIGNLPLQTYVDFSMPAGNTWLDDYKVRIGGKIRWFAVEHIQFSTRFEAVFRREKNDFVRLLNFGRDMSGILGYYRGPWFAAAEVGFDKAVVTHFQHEEAYKDQFPGVRDGWYLPPTGGNFYAGFQLGATIGKQDIYLRAGRILVQDFKRSPLIPYYSQIGVNAKF